MPQRHFTDVQIKTVALMAAQVQGVTATLSECFISPTTQKILVDEATGELQVIPQTIWEVHVLPHGGSKQYGRGISILIESDNGILTSTGHWPLP